MSPDLDDAEGKTIHLPRLAPGVMPGAR
jgi:hypothetical protein